MAPLMFLLLLLSQAASETIVVEQQIGQDVTLPCRAGGGSIRAVEWTKPDLKSPEYVLFYSDGHSDTADQHQSFKGRVELVDKEMKDGNVSLILRNLNNDDNGTYECQVALGGSRRHKRSMKPINTITLNVLHSGPQSGHMGMDMYRHHTLAELIIGVALVCLVAVMFVAVWKSKKQQTSAPPAADEAAGVQLV